MSHTTLVRILYELCIVDNFFTQEPDQFRAIGSSFACPLASRLFAVVPTKTYDSMQCLYYEEKYWHLDKQVDTVTCMDKHPSHNEAVHELVRTRRLTTYADNKLNIHARSFENW